MKSFFSEKRGQKLGCVLYTGAHYTRVNTVYSIIIQPLVLFNAIKIVLYQEPHAVLTAIFENMLVCALPLQVVILGFGIDFHKAILECDYPVPVQQKKTEFSV